MLQCHEDDFTYSCMDTCWRLAQNNLLIFPNNQPQRPNRKLMRARKFTAGELAGLHWELKQSNLLGIPAHEPSPNVALKPIKMFWQLPVFYYKISNLSAFNN